MAPLRERSPEPFRPTKKPKTGSLSSGDPFFQGLLLPESVASLNVEYKTSSPFKHCVVEQLFKDTLLESVKEEILQNIHFTEKETDIYRVHQTGDLASLSFLTQEQLSLFPSLISLRNALYSTEFREFVRSVTGCGHLSGSKQDMSVNSYKKGCHLLNHDDVIGSRRVSYILYLPLPHRESWRPEYGGGLELYPVQETPFGLEPEPTPSKTIPPGWNQFIFFEVQPGRSFHSVEEVVVGTDEDGRQRLSISGWLHKPQSGEEGYAAEVEFRDQSSLEQLSTTSIALAPYPKNMDVFLPGTPLTSKEKTFLSKYLNPVYLTNQTLVVLASRFAEESSLELHAFLVENLASELETFLRLQDQDDGYTQGARGERTPQHDSGISGGSGWKLTGPPHKRRYCLLQSTETSHPTPDSTPSSMSILQELQDVLFPSAAFRSWLAALSSLLPLGYAVEARRFRPGLDYTLARSEGEARLDVCLGLTPKSFEGPGWEGGSWGGWECYMAPHEGDDDPAVYRSGNKKSDNEEEDGTLLISQPSFNNLLLVLRDQGVLKFVKYVSASAQGSRWDISGEWEVGDVEIGSESGTEHK